jgi:hypothetical protein
MTDSDIAAARRFGDPGAPRFRIAPWSVVVVILVSAFAVSGGIALLIHSIEVHDRVHLLGSELGIGLGAAILLALAIAFALYGRAVRRAVRAALEQHPSDLVIGARVPDLGNDLLSRTWPASWRPVLGPQQLAVRIDATGVEFVSAKPAGAPLASLTWDQVTGISPCEYVEQRVAYQGLAIEASEAGTGILLQVMKPGLIPRFVGGKALAVLAARSEAERPQQDGGTDSARRSSSLKP